MADSWRTVRVFISSTFRDMQAERDHLVTVIWPKLRERVEQVWLEFFDVNLHWGVPAKDTNGGTADSWECCRQWIDRVELPLRSLETRRRRKSHEFAST